MGTYGKFFSLSLIFNNLVLELLCLLLICSSRHLLILKVVLQLVIFGKFILETLENSL